MSLKRRVVLVSGRCAPGLKQLNVTRIRGSKKKSISKKGVHGMGKRDVVGNCPVDLQSAANKYKLELA